VLSDDLQRADLPLKKRRRANVQKKIKKIVDDLVAKLNLTKTRADASRYFMCGKGGWPHEPTKPVVSNGGSGWPSH